MRELTETDVLMLRKLEMIRQHFGEEFDNNFRLFEYCFIDGCTYNGKKIESRKQFDDIISGAADVPEEKYAIEYGGQKVYGMDDWNGGFAECFNPGDFVNCAIAEHFLNVLPPIRSSSTYIQMGEPHDHNMDESGKYKPRYLTLECVKGSIHETDSVWKYCGICFVGKNRMEAEK